MLSYLKETRFYDIRYETFSFYQVRAKHEQIKRKDFNIILNERESLLYNQEIPWQKKNTNLFDAAVGAYDGPKVC